MTRQDRYNIAVADNDLTTCMELAEYSNEDLMRKMHSVFKGFDKSSLSKCKNPEYYGICIHPEGYEMMRSFVEDGTVKPADLHKWKRNLHIRLPDEEYSQLIYYMRLEGYCSKQDFARKLVQDYIREAVQKYGSD